MELKFVNSNVSRHPFDLNVIEHSVHFPRMVLAPKDTELLNAITKRNQDLTPTYKEQQALSILLSKVTIILENLVIAAGDFDIQLEEFRLVGSYKKGTMRTGKNNADIVVIFKSIPKKETIQAFSKKVEKVLKEIAKTEDISKNDMITIQITENGFEIFNRQARVCILIATIPPNIHKVENPEMQKHLVKNLSAIRHILFFETNSNSSVKLLIRIFRDIAARFESFSVMNPWMIELLVNFAILPNTYHHVLPINEAFRRIFQLLASGLFIPGSLGIPDPCESVPISVHSYLTLEQQDNICMTAQTLLRVLIHGGYKVILGIDKRDNLFTEMSVFDDVVIYPLKLAYEPQTDTEKRKTDKIINSVKFDSITDQKCDSKKTISKKKLRNSLHHFTRKCVELRKKLKVLKFPNSKKRIKKI